MSSDAVTALLMRCAELEREERHAEALELLHGARGTEAEDHALYWAWMGSTLLRCRRLQEAEQTLRAVLVHPRWPNGDATIVQWLGEVLLWAGRHQESIEAVESCARSGHLDCELVRLRALLALGKSAYVLEVARALTASDQGEPGPRLVLLEAILDVRGSGHDPELTEAANRVRDQLRNAQRAGIFFSPFALSRLVRLESRLGEPFGFSRRKAPDTRERQG